MINAVEDFLDDLRGGKMSESPTVRVEQGELLGRLVSSPSGKGFYTFLGIPYAKPPIGSLRFRAPQPPEAWEGVRDATSEGNSAAQVDHFFHKSYVGDENCLYLNVYTPSIEGEFLPVMVFIHGGAYRFGTGSPLIYGGDYFIEKDVVLVTINYRCGPLGFLSLNTPEVPGNAGLKDMVQALRWVKENIKSFGGNSGNMTVFGHSAGAASTALLTASPLTKNLMNRVIIQSGTPLSNWCFQSNPVENALALASELGCESHDVYEVLDFLETTPVKDIVIAYENTHPMEKSLLTGKTVFAPVIEKEFPGVEAFLTEPFTDILTSGRTANIPVMIGSTTLEFAYDRNVDDLQDFIPEDLNIEKNSPEALQIAKQIEKLYFKGNPSDEESIRERFQLVSDSLINVAEHRYLQYLIKSTNKPIYYYKFNYIGNLNISKITGKNPESNYVGHSDELDYLFKSEMSKDVEPTPQDIKIRERLLRLWTNFAKDGNPTPDENHYITVTWLPINKDKQCCLIIGKELTLDVNPDHEKMEFWENLYNKYYKIWNHSKTNEDSPIPVAPVSPVCERIEKSEISERPEIPESASVPHIVEDTVATIIQTNDSEVVESHVTVVETTVTEVHNNVENNIENKVEEPADVTDHSEPPKIEHERIEIKQNNAHKESVVGADESINVQEKIAHHEQMKATTNGSNGDDIKLNGTGEKKPRPSNEIKMVQPTNFNPKDVIRANDPPEDDLPKNIGVNKFVNFFESLGGKK